MALLCVGERERDNVGEHFFFGVKVMLLLIIIILLERPRGLRSAPISLTRLHLQAIN